MQKDLDLMRSVSVHNFKNVSFFSRLFLLQNSMWCLKIIFFVLTYSTNLHLKVTIILNTKWHLYGQCLKELKDIEDVRPSSQSRTFLRSVKGHWRCLSFILVRDIEKENCLHQKILWNWQCHIHMKYGEISF